MNDEQYLSHFRNINYYELLGAAEPLCRYLRDNQQETDKFYVTWVESSEGKADIFVLCCQQCPKMRNKAELQILLKSEYLIRRFAITHSYPMDKGGQMLGSEIHFETYRRRNVNQMETCYDENYRKVTVIIY
ncbi:unnamed protein product [Gongylonema pulchrum]|uniref:ADF-H domain-containing protein n=1 Tax=Gongylonema pulchrum TaxID=637853 RepID=A0A183DB54_9BILA|nr:unnamed protein product [Gongylonema pulchrum]